MMDKLLHYRFFRFLVCFVLVCAILINCSPLRAEATVIGATVVTGTAAAGILGLLFSMAMGVVFVDITAEMVSGIGQSVIDSVTNKYANDTETSNTVKEYFDDLSYTFGGSGDDGTGNGDGKIHILDGIILTGLVAWVSSLIKNDGAEIDEEAAEGYEYFNDNSLAILPEIDIDSYPYLCIVRQSDEYVLLCSPVPFMCEHTFSSPSISGDNGGPSNAAAVGVSYSGDGSSWSFRSSQSYHVYSGHGSDFVWANHNINRYTHKDGYTGETCYFGSATSNVKYVTVEPSTYVGDIPSQVQDGSFDEEKYSLPYIDYSKILPGLNDYVTELNNLAQQLADNTKTYEEYMKDIQPEQTPDPDPSPDPSDPSDPEETEPEEDEGDEEEEKDLDMFTLDLSDYFPFCIPFDLYDFFTCLNADPVAPVIEWFVPLPGGGTYPLRIDLSAYDDVAQLLRRLQLLLFCVGLAFKTRDLIKG